MFFHIKHGDSMELECAKYGEKMDAAQVACRHPGDYCQFRQSCMIQFMERENRSEKAADESKTEKKS
jgi:hypothetical protein